MLFPVCVDDYFLPKSKLQRTPPTKVPNKRMRSSSSPEISGIKDRRILYSYALSLIGDKKRLLLKSNHLANLLKTAEETLKTSNFELDVLKEKLRESHDNEESVVSKLQASEEEVSKLQEENRNYKEQLTKISSKLQEAEEKFNLAIADYECLTKIQGSLNECQSALSNATEENKHYKDKIAELTLELDEKTKNLQALQNIKSPQREEHAASVHLPVPCCQNQHGSVVNRMPDTPSSQNEDLPSLQLPRPLISPLPATPIAHCRRHPRFTWKCADNSFILSFPKTSEDQEATIICTNEGAKVVYKLPKELNIDGKSPKDQDLSSKNSAHGIKDLSAVRKRLHNDLESSRKPPDSPVSAKRLMSPSLVPVPSTSTASISKYAPSTEALSAVRKRLNDDFDSKQDISSFSPVAKSMSLSPEPIPSIPDSVEHNSLLIPIERMDQHNPPSLTREISEDPSIRLPSPKEDCDSSDACEVIEILENLDLLQECRESMDQLANKLANALTTAIDEHWEIKAIEYTVNFLGSRSINPILESARVDKMDFLPAEELCIVKSYKLLKDKSYLDKLADLMYLTIMNVDPRNFSCLALCRVFTTIQKEACDIQKARNFCYDLLKKHVKVAPVLVASIASIWPDVLAKQTVNGSALYVANVISYLLLSNPGIEEKLWQACVAFYHKFFHLSKSDKEPIHVVESMIDTIELISAKECFSKEDVRNYTLALELLCTRFDDNWISKNIVKHKLFPVIEKFSVTNNTKMCGAIVLCYKFMCASAKTSTTQTMCLDFIKKILTAITRNTVHAPLPILMESYYSYYVLYKECHGTVDKGSLKWLQRHGFKVDKKGFKKIM